MSIRRGRPRVSSCQLWNVRSDSELFCNMAEPLVLETSYRSNNLVLKAFGARVSRDSTASTAARIRAFLGIS
jgi:hypothetical protein